MTKSTHAPQPGGEPSGERRPPRPRRRAVLVGLSAAVTFPLCLAAWASLPAPATGAVEKAAPPAVGGTIRAAAPAAPSPTATPPGASTTAPLGALNKELATSTVKGFLESVAAVDPTSKSLGAKLSAVARGAIVDELENEQQELESNGWTQRGKATVKSVTIISTNLTATPPAAVAQACVDSGKVVTLDADGRPLAGTDPAAAHAALNIYSLQQDGGTWRITARTFPDDPAC
ncbi:hypothetical protein SAMN05216282_10954 [Cryobacterium psychrotolerans]|uniref:Uncharacterized protein n=1 Tax=Cryobacterium psychrotolerans TaxID=386301 RepID=A0A1G9DIH1_9MICO|nr:hypothetical protein [Cryobacterium psychrotolerans]TFD86891.1 hypothetical protein E3T56_06375 [Cryobacterium psychrotolerans]SDK63575.1 hypothetical protein SAMN05216282_10954 [Cryobacterium psychrotolerans]